MNNSVIKTTMNLRIEAVVVGRVAMKQLANADPIKGRTLEQIQPRANALANERRGDSLQLPLARRRPHATRRHRRVGRARRGQHRPAQAFVHHLVMSKENIPYNFLLF